MTQAQALDILKSGMSVFLTGEPGSGKTYVLNQYLTYLHQHAIKVAVTASTGIAATHIGGSTIHSWSGVGIKKYITERDKDTLLQRESFVRRLQKPSVLVIDEVSMLDARIIDAVDELCRAARGNEKPFGGLQVVFVGDFFQLPPIDDASGARFSFTSRAWNELDPRVLYLTEQHRHTDTRLAELLLCIRRGEDIDRVQELLIECAETEFPEGVTPTHLGTHVAHANEMNQGAFAEIEEPHRHFHALTSGRKEYIERLAGRCLSPEKLTLARGAVVMCTKNNSEAGFANGTLGVIESFDEETEYPILETYDGRQIIVEPMEWSMVHDDKVRATFRQVPLCLAWAITIHKSQGMSLDAVSMDLSRAFAYGQGYVALSRARTLDRLHVRGYNQTALLVDPHVQAMDAKWVARSEELEAYVAAAHPDAIKESHDAFIIAQGGSLSRVEPTPTESTRVPSHRTTLGLIRQGMTADEVAKERNLSATTILGHIEMLVDENELSKEQAKKAWDIDLVDDDIAEIVATFKKKKTDKLSPVKTALNNRFTYEEIRYARLFVEDK